MNNLISCNTKQSHCVQLLSTCTLASQVLTVCPHVFTCLMLMHTLAQKAFTISPDLFRHKAVSLCAAAFNLYFRIRSTYCVSHCVHLLNVGVHFSAKGIHHLYFACVIWSLTTQSRLTVCSCFQLVLQNQRHLLFLRFWHFGQQFLSDGIRCGVCIHRDVQLGSLQEYITQQNSAEISPVLETDWQGSTMNWPCWWGWGEGWGGGGTGSKVTLLGWDSEVSFFFFNPKTSTHTLKG